MQTKILFLLIIVCLFLSFQNGKAQTAPVISYTANNYTYIKGQTITTLLPINSAGIVSGSLVTTVAGNGTVGSTDGIGTSASFNLPYGITIDASENLYVTDFYNYNVRKITAAGVVTTVAVKKNVVASGSKNTGDIDRPTWIAVDVAGNLYVNDYDNEVLKITTTGLVDNFAGADIPSFADGKGKAAGFYDLRGITIDAFGNLFVVDENNRRIRKITHEGEVSTFAGNGNHSHIDGTGTAASFSSPANITIDKDGNLYVSDAAYNILRKITPLGVVTTLVDFQVSSILTSGMAIDVLGNIYIVDVTNSLIKKITPAEVITTVAGNGVYGFADGNGSTASFAAPRGLTIDSYGNLYVADSDNHRIRKITFIKGSYSISPILPAGLTFDTTTGAITGTPSELMPTTIYTVTATNDFGSSSFDIAITINELVLDQDNDGVEDAKDNCPEIYNTDQIDSNDNGIGDACDPTIEDLIIYNTISPNTDGDNDTWLILNIEKHPNTSVRVFNRWGREVFYSKEYKNEWDGDDLPRGVYYYNINTDDLEVKNYTGWLYLSK